MWYQLPANFKYMTNSIKVKLDIRELEVKKLPLGKYAELLKAVHELPKNLGGLDKMTNDQLFEKLPFLIATSLPDLMGILAIATDLKAEEINEMGLDEAVKVIVAVIEVNNYRNVFENIKKVVARPTTPQAPTKTNG